MIIDDDRWIELDDMLLLFLTWQVCSDTLNSHVHTSCAEYDVNIKYCILCVTDSIYGIAVARILAGSQYLVMYTLE